MKGRTGDSAGSSQARCPEYAVNNTEDKKTRSPYMYCGMHVPTITCIKRDKMNIYK